MSKADQPAGVVVDRGVRPAVDRRTFAARAKTRFQRCSSGVRIDAVNLGEDADRVIQEAADLLRMLVDQTRAIAAAKTQDQANNAHFAFEDVLADAAIWLQERGPNAEVTR